MAEATATVLHHRADDAGARSRGCGPSGCRWPRSGRCRHGRAQLSAPPGEEAGLVHPESGDWLPVALVDGQEAPVGAAALHHTGDVTFPVGSRELDASPVLV